MKRALRRSLIALVLLLGQFVTSAAAQERIRAFDVDLRIERDGTFLVTERIRYDFGSHARRGIFRDIPVRYGRGSAADYRIELEVESVRDAMDRDWPYKLLREGPNQRLRIGDPNRTIEGEHEYRITYRVARGTLWLEEHDEIYWNVTGNGWEIPIESAHARISIPASERDPLRVLCFTGPQGAVEANCTAEASNTDARFAAMQPLGPREGLTVVLAIPKGVLSEPSTLSKLLDRASDYLNAAFFLPLLTLLGFGGIWYKTGRDPVGATAIPVRYEPPAGATPGSMGTLIDEKADLRDITGTVLDLAIRGYLRIGGARSHELLVLLEDGLRLRAVEQGCFRSAFPRRRRAHPLCFAPARASSFRISAIISTSACRLSKRRCMRKSRRAGVGFPLRPTPYGAATC